MSAESSPCDWRSAGPQPISASVNNPTPKDSFTISGLPNVIILITVTSGTKTEVPSADHILHGPAPARRHLPAQERLPGRAPAGEQVLPRGTALLLLEEAPMLGVPLLDDKSLSPEVIPQRLFTTQQHGASSSLYRESRGRCLPSGSCPSEDSRPTHRQSGAGSCT